MSDGRQDGSDNILVHIDNKVNIGVNLGIRQQSSMSAEELHTFESIILMTEIEWIICLEYYATVSTLPLVADYCQKGYITSL